MSQRNPEIHDAMSTGSRTILHDTDEIQIGSRQNALTEQGDEHSPKLGQWAAFSFCADKLFNAPQKNSDNKRSEIMFESICTTVFA